LRVVRTARAEEDLVEIWLRVGKDDQRAADRVLEDLELRTQRLAQHPEIGRKRPDIATGLRYLPVGPYLVLYKVSGDRIEIVRYVHGRRDLKHMV
jgi:toxin ParE1/3/4